MSVGSRILQLDSVIYRFSYRMREYLRYLSGLGFEIWWETLFFLLSSFLKSSSSFHIWLSNFVYFRIDGHKDRMFNFFNAW
jgi:hypothetical protein